LQSSSISEYPINQLHEAKTLIGYQSLNNSTNSTVFLVPEGYSWYLKQPATGSYLSHINLAQAFSFNFLMSILISSSYLTPARLMQRDFEVTQLPTKQEPWALSLALTVQDVKFLTDFHRTPS
jgi:hypothetical protein